MRAIVIKLSRLACEVRKARQEIRNMEKSLLAALRKTERKIIMKLSELKGIGEETKRLLTEAFGELSTKVQELNTKIQELTDQLASGDVEVPAEAAATFQEVKALGQQLADIITPIAGGQQRKPKK